jgi:hypothetical protein
MQTLLETLVIDWAKKNGYIINNRKYFPEIIAELAGSLQLGKDPSMMSTVIEDGNTDAAIKRDLETNPNESWEPNMKRDIYIPTGMVSYSLFIEDCINEEQIDAALRNGEDPCEILWVCHGQPIPDWESSNLSEEAREAASRICIRLIKYADAKRITPEELTVTYSQSAVPPEPIIKFRDGMIYAPVKAPFDNPIKKQMRCNGKTYQILLDWISGIIKEE